MASQGTLAYAGTSGYVVHPPDQDSTAADLGAGGRPPGPQDPRKWARVARDLADRIASGDPGPGARLPRTPDLAREPGVSPRVITRAAGKLARDGMVRVVPGHGYYVTSPAEPDHDQRETGRVAAILLGRILNATMRAGSPVPPAAELAAQLGVTRATMTRALASLASQGVLEHPAGKPYRVRTSFTVPHPGTRPDADTHRRAAAPPAPPGQRPRQVNPPPGRLSATSALKRG